MAGHVVGLRQVDGMALGQAFDACYVLGENVVHPCRVVDAIGPPPVGRLPTPIY